MKISHLTSNEVFHALVTSDRGLDRGEARRRLAEFGPNRIEESGRKPLFLRFTGQFTHFLAILLWIAAALSFLSEYLHPGEGMLTLGAAILTVILLNAFFTFFQEYRAELALEAMKRMLPFEVKTVRGGVVTEVPAVDIVPGDIILLEEGDRVPADTRLIASASLSVSNAPLTGESEPVSRSAAPFDGDLFSSPNIVYAGTTVVVGSGRGAVFATGMRTEFGRIAQLTGTVTPGLSPLQKEIVKITRIIGAIATIMGLLFFIIGQIIGRTFWDNFLFTVGIIVANVPEGLLPTVTLSLAMASRRMARRNVIIKTLTSVETLGSVSVICTDKTGTLTKNIMTVAETACLGDEPGANDAWLHTVGMLCNNAREVDGEIRGDPTEAGLLRAGRQVRIHTGGQRLREFPFDVERKRMSTITMVDGAPILLTKGAPESVLAVCSSCRIGAREVPFEPALRSEADRLYSALMDRGLRVLACAIRPLDSAPSLPDAPVAECDLVFIGFIGLEDPPRPEVAEAIRKCRAGGIRIIMITGDASRTALAVAHKVDLAQDDAIAIEGHDVDRLSDGDLRAVLAKGDVIFSRMSPRHKLRIVHMLKEEGERVAVTGDGVNDAPALKRADIGIAMGLSGTDVAREAADMILLDDNFASIVNAIEEGRAVYENIRKFMSYIFSSNIPEIVPYLAFVLFRIPLPLTIIQILAVDIGTDMLPALALGAEKPTPELMERPPRSRHERLLSRALFARAYLFLGPIEAGAAMAGFFFVLSGGGWQWGEALPSRAPLYLQATTACLAAIIVTQMANVFACRSMKESAFTLGLFSNKLLFAGIASEALILLFIVYTPAGNTLFGTAPLAAPVWFILAPFSMALFAAEEFRKALARRFSYG